MYLPFKFTALAKLTVKVFVYPLTHPVGVILAIPRLLGPVKLAFSSKKESQLIATSLRILNDLSKHAMVPTRKNRGVGGGIISVLKSASHPVHETLLSDLK